MDNLTDTKVPPLDVDNKKEEKKGEDGSDAGNGASENKDAKNKQQEGPSSDNRAKVEGDFPFTVQGSQVFNNATFNFGERRSTEPGPDDTKHKKFYDVVPPGDGTRNANESKKPEQPTPKNLLDLTSDFVAPRSSRSQFDEAELLNQFKDLETNNLIFITCADEQMAKAAACALAEKLSLPDPAQKRLLDFGRIGPEDSERGINELLQGVPRKFEVAVIVDLFNPKAEKFFYSLIDNVVHSADSLWQDLQRTKIYLICVVNAAGLNSKLTLLNAPTAFTHDRLFPHWQISFLEPLLQLHFPENYHELAAKIRKRRNLWDPDERVFCQQLKTLIHERRLEQILETPVRVEDVADPQTLFKNQDPLSDVVLYAGTFFTDLKPREFNRVVNLLLGNKTKTITVSTVRKNENGASEQIEVEREKPLAELWQESMDKIKAECGLTAAPAADGSAVVGFRNHQLRDELRDYLRSDYPFFLNNQLEQLMNVGLLFDSSSNIATRVINLAADVALTDPEYLQEWIENLLDEMQEFFVVDPDSTKTVGPILQPLATLKYRDAQERICQRLAGLLKRMIEVHRLNETANEMLEQFMRRSLFLHVLEIDKALRFVADFNEFYWYKQLIERGDNECRRLTVLTLSQRMQHSGPRAYQMLQEMDSWVKADQESRSRSGMSALELLIDFCLQTTVFLSPDQYGVWPSSHPLFRFTDAKSASEGLRLLNRWLCHPWMSAVIVEQFETPSANYSIGALIAEWIFILLKPGESSTSLTEFEPVNLGVTAPEVSQILIQQLALATDKKQQDELLFWWELRGQTLLKQVEQLSHVDAEGSVKIWKRNLLNDLIAQFKVAVYERQAAQMAIS